jgi:ferredoxin-NADP reductase
MAVVTFRTKLVRKEKASDDAWKFFFEKPSNFNYQAGQYIKLFLDIKKPDSRGKTRYFTLSSSPNEKHLLITTRILKSSYKLKLGSLKLGSIVKMRGPWGDFLLEPKEKRPLVFIAGGIGMTPFISMIKYAYEMKLDSKTTLLVSYKTPGQILFKDELEAVSKKTRSIRIITTITQPENSKWKGEIGRIDRNFIERHIANTRDNLYYVAGPDPMVEEMERLLISMKISKKQIMTDGFPGY